MLKYYLKITFLIVYSLFTIANDCFHFIRSGTYGFWVYVFLPILGYPVAIYQVFSSGTLEKALNLVICVQSMII